MPPRSRIPRAASFKDLPKTETDRTENQEIHEDNHHDAVHRQTDTANQTRQLRRGPNRPSPPAASSARTRTMRELSNTPSPDDGVKKTKANSPATQILALTRIPGPSARPTKANTSSPLAVIDESDVDPDVTRQRAAVPNATATSLARRATSTANSSPSVPSIRGLATTRPLATRARARAGTLSVTTSEFPKSLLAADRTPAFLRLERPPIPASPDSDGADADISNVMSVDSPTAPQQESPSSGSSESSPPDSPTPAPRSHGGSLWPVHDGAADDEAIEDDQQETNTSKSANDADDDTSNEDLGNGNDTFAVESDHSNGLSDASSDHLIPPRPNAPTPRSASGSTRDRRPRLVPMNVADMFDQAGEPTAAVSVSGSASTATASSTPDKNPSSSPVTSPEQCTAGASGHSTSSSSDPDIEADHATDAEEILNGMIAELDQAPPRNRSRSHSTSVVPFRPQPSAFEAMRCAITPLPPTPDEIHELEARERDIRQAHVQDDDEVYESGSEKENSPPLVRSREHRPALFIAPLGSLSHRSSQTHLNDMRARLASSTASTSTTHAPATAAPHLSPALVKPYMPTRLDQRQIFDELHPTPPKSSYDSCNGGANELAHRASMSSLSGVSGSRASSSASAKDAPAPATPQSSRKDKGKSKAADEKRERHAPGFDIYRDPPPAPAPKTHVKDTLAWGDGLWSFDTPEKVSTVEVSAYDVIRASKPEPEAAPAVVQDLPSTVQVQDNTSLEWLHGQNINLPYRDPAEYDHIYEDDDEGSNPRLTLFALTGIEMTNAPLANADLGIVPLFITSKSHARSKSTSAAIVPATDNQETRLVPSRLPKHTFPEVTVEEEDEAALMHSTLAAASARTVAEDKRQFLKDYNGTLAGHIDMLQEQDMLLDETNELLARLRRMGDHGHWEAPLQTLIAAKKKRDRTRSMRNTTPPPSRDASDDEGMSEDEDEEDDNGRRARPHARVRTRSEGMCEARYRDRPDSDRHIRLRLRSETASTANTPSLSRSLGTGTSVAFSDITVIESPLISPTRPNNFRTLAKSRSNRSLGRVGTNPPLTPLTPTSILHLPTEYHRHTAASDHLPATPPGKRESNVHRIARLGVPLTPSPTPSPERPGNVLRRGSISRRRSPGDSVYDSPSPSGATAGSHTSRHRTPTCTGDTAPAGTHLPPASLLRSNSARTAAVAAAAAEDQQRYRRWGRNRSDERAERVRLRDRLRRIVTPAPQPAPPSHTVSPTRAAPNVPPKEATPLPKQVPTGESYWCDSDEEKR